MDTSTWILFALVALIGANQLIMRTPWARDDARFFWGVSILDLVVGVAVLALGLPGFETFPAVSWVVGLVLIAHVAQNLQLRANWAEEERKEAQAQRDAERKRMRQEREAHEEADDHATQ